MTTGKALDDLIARLEKATGPSLELDARIACVLTGWTFVRMNGIADNAYMADKIGETRSVFYLEREHYYTASIDAALTLVPENWDGEVWFRNAGCRLWVESIGSPETAHYDAPMPAIALCIAALKARKTEDKTP